MGDAVKHTAGPRISDATAVAHTAKELLALDPVGLNAAVRECARTTAPEITDEAEGMAMIEISNVEILALKKIALINYALAQSLSDKRAASEQLALTKVITDIARRAEDAPTIERERQ